MSTRACYGFTESETMGGNTYWIYVHYDGYPEGAAAKFANSLCHAWILPRFEADEFAAAFVAGNKGVPRKDNENTLLGGHVRLTASPYSHCDIEYVYEVFQGNKNSQLVIKAYKADKFPDAPFFYGRLKDFIAEYGDIEPKKTWNKFGPKSANPIPETPRKPKKEICPCCGKEK